jgi:hypothetical protein
MDVPEAILQSKDTSRFYIVEGERSAPERIIGVPGL